MKASVEHIPDHIPAAVAHGLADSEEEARAILELCEFTWIDDPKEMREALELYYSIMFDLDPSLLGGSLPDDGFYLDRGASF